MNPNSGSRSRAVFILNVGAEWTSVVNIAPRPLTPALNTTGKISCLFWKYALTNDIGLPIFVLFLNFLMGWDVYVWVALQPVTCLSSLPTVGKWVCNICTIVEECSSVAWGKSVPVLFCPPCMHMDPGRCRCQKVASIPNKDPDESHSLSAFLWNWLFVPPPVNAR